VPTRNQIRVCVDERIVGGGEEMGGGVLMPAVERRDVRKERLIFPEDDEWSQFGKISLVISQARELRREMFDAGKVCVGRRRKRWSHRRISSRLQVGRCMLDPHGYQSHWITWTGHRCRSFPIIDQIVMEVEKTSQTLLLAVFSLTKRTARVVIGYS
jgi:hypothetical protein